MPIEPVAAAAPDTPWKRRIGGLAAVAALGPSALAGCSDDEPPADTGGDGGGVATDTGGATGGSIPGKEPSDRPDEGADEGRNNDSAQASAHWHKPPHEATKGAAGARHGEAGSAPATPRGT